VSALDKAWDDCRSRRGTATTREIEALLKAYFAEGYDYGREGRTGHPLPTLAGHYESPSGELWTLHGNGQWFAHGDGSLAVLWAVEEVAELAPDLAPAIRLYSVPEPIRTSSTDPVKETDRG